MSNRDGLDTEELYAINAKTGEEVARITNQNFAKTIERTKKFNDAITSADEVILLHNHPGGYPPSDGDINALLKYGTKAGVTVGHDGSIYYYTKPNEIINESDFKFAMYKYKIYNEDMNIEKALSNLSEKFGYIIKVIKEGQQMHKTYFDDHKMSDQRTLDMLNEIKDMTEEEFEEHIRQLREEEAKKKVIFYARDDKYIIDDRNNTEDHIIAISEMSLDEIYDLSEKMESGMDVEVYIED